MEGLSLSFLGYLTGENHRSAPSLICGAAPNALPASKVVAEQSLEFLIPILECE
jgi:hypothetical protein